MRGAELVDGDVVPELAGVRATLLNLDKALRTHRTYGPQNPVARRFLDDFYAGLTELLIERDRLVLLVRRSELVYAGVVAYEHPVRSENLAFKLHADGIRELAFLRGMTADDVRALLDVFGADVDPRNLDDDLVTRMWQRNIPNVAMITAEEMISSAGLPGVLQADAPTLLDGPLDALKAIHARERSHGAASLAPPENASEAPGAAWMSGRATEATGVPPGRGGDAEARLSRGATGPPDPRLSRGATGPPDPRPADALAARAGYAITEEDVAAIAHEFELEQESMGAGYVLRALHAVLGSDRAPTLIARLAELLPEMLDLYMAEGAWRSALDILALAERAGGPEGIPLPDLSELPRIQIVEQRLNGDPEGAIDGLADLLARLGPEGVPALCRMLGNLDHEPHRTLVCDALIRLAPSAIDTLVAGFDDPRPDHVRRLLHIVEDLGDPGQADSVAVLARHPNVAIRADAVRVFAVLRSKGDGTTLLRFIDDHDAATRVAALKRLASGMFTTPLEGWQDRIVRDDFLGRAPPEQRLILRAFAASTGDAGVPSLQALITRWFWSDERREQVGVLAVEALAELRTPAGRAALVAGQKRMNAAIRRACANALTVERR